MYLFCVLTFTCALSFVRVTSAPFFNWVTETNALHLRIVDMHLVFIFIAHCYTILLWWRK